jgi:predicted nucleic-acid-binding protein
MNNALMLDANVIIRFLTGEPQQQAELSKKIFRKAVSGEITLLIETMIVAECVWVLQKVYGFDKKIIIEKLLNLFTIDGIEVVDKEIVSKALLDFSNNNVDFMDALLASFSNKKQIPVVTWNVKHFKRLDCEYYTPEQVVDEDK